MAVATSTAVLSMAAISAVSAASAASANNRAMGAAQDNARRRYELQANQSKSMMEEQQIIARDKMTDITRAFLQAKGKATAIQAETMVTGASSQRVAAVQRSKFSEAKGKVAQEVNTNIINIANDMLTKQIDTEAIIREAESKKKNVFTETALGAINGGLAGYSLGKSMGATGVTDSAGVGAKTMSNVDSVGYGFDSQTTFGGGGVNPTNASAGWYTP